MSVLNAPFRTFTRPVAMSGDVLVERAAALVPLLRDQQDESDARGHYSDEMHEAFHAAGLYRILQPKTFGGLEFGFKTFFQVVTTIARGHPGAAWCYCLASSHAALLASYWSEEAQTELFGQGDFRACHRAIPAGAYTPVDGGYRVSGVWSYASGSPVSTHIALGGLIPDPKYPSAAVNFFVRRDQATVLQDWGGDTALGMQSSGSNTVKLDDVFVPDRHFYRGDILFGRDIDWQNGTAGTRLHGNPLYLGVFGGPYQLSFSAITLGAARAAIEEFTANIRERKSMSNPTLKAFQDPDIQRKLGEASVLADSAEAILYAATDLHREFGERWSRSRAPITAENTMRLWAMARQSSTMSCEAVELLFRASAPMTASKGQRLQRYFRDVQMYRIHPSAQPWVDLARGETALDLPISRFAARR